MLVHIVDALLHSVLVVAIVVGLPCGYYRYMYSGTSIMQITYITPMGSFV